MRDKAIVLGMEYERWSIIFMMLSLWKKNLKHLERLGDVLPRQTWEELKEGLGEARKDEKGSAKRRKVFDALKKLVNSVHF